MRAVLSAIVPRSARATIPPASTVNFDNRERQKDILRVVRMQAGFVKGPRMDGNI